LDPSKDKGAEYTNENALDLKLYSKDGQLVEDPVKFLELLRKDEGFTEDYYRDPMM